MANEKGNCFFLNVDSGKNEIHFREENVFFWEKLLKIVHELE